MKHVVRYFIFISLIILLFLPVILFPQSSKYQIIDKINIGGRNHWDYLTADTAVNKLFISHGNIVNTVNLKTNKLTGKITNLHHTHGIAVADQYGKGFISNGRNNTVTVFNLKTLKKIKEIPVTGKDPDAIVYDPFSKRVFTFNGRSNNSTAIDAESGKVVGTVKLDGRPEFAVSNNKGKMYVNIVDKNEIQEFNPLTLKANAVWSIAPGKHPSGLAIDRRNNILFSGCRNKTMVVLNANTGKVITYLPIGEGVDGCSFDPSENLAFASCWNGKVTIIREESPKKFEVIDNAKTTEGARTMTLDEITHRIYTSAMINEPNSGKNNSKTFGVLILGKE